MARGGRVIYKKNTTVKNRKARLKHDGDGDDDEDEEYVLEEDEDEESESNFGSDVNSRDLSDDFDFRESDRSDDEEEEKEIKIAKSKKKRGNRRKSTVSDDEMDADYELDDDKEERGVEIARSKKKRRNLKKSRLSGDEIDSDYELDDEEEEEKEFNIAKSKKKQINRKKFRVSDDEMESDYEMDEEKELKIGKSKKKQGHRKKPRISDDEMDSDYEVDGKDEEKEVKIARLAMKRRNLKKSRLSDDEMDSDYELDHEDEVKEVKIGSSKKKSRVFYDDMDSNYELDDEEVDEEFEIGRSKKKQGDCNKNRFFDDEMEDLLIPKRQGRGRPQKKETKDSDYELDDENEEIQFKSSRSKGNCKKSRVSEDEYEEKELTIARSKKYRGNRQTSRVSNAEMENILVPKRMGKGRPRKQNSRDSDYELDDDEDFSPDEDDFDEDEISIASKQTAKASKTKGRMKKRRNGMIRSSDDEFVVKDRVLVGRKRKRSKNVRKRSSEADLMSLDLDFVTSDDDFVEKDIVRIHNRRKNNKKVTKGTGLKGRRKKKLAEGSESSDSDFVISDDDDVEDDDDFNVKDQVVLYKQEMNRKKEKVGEANRRKRRKRSTADLESSDSDYLISEDDEDFIVAEDHVVMDRQPQMSKKARKKRSRSSVDSDPDSFDFDDANLEEEVRDLRIGGSLNHEKPKRVITGKKVEEKGKEKQADDSGKQVCGICLSEEKKSVVQGLLNCCTHYFCFACIMEWSKVESRCPLCKRRFVTISKLGKSNPGLGMRSSVIRVEKRDQVYQPSEEELRGILDPYENVVCMECQQGGDDSLMLLCDTCDSSAHTYCVGLGREVPEGNWYCECCRSVSDGPSNSQFQDTMLNQETRNNNLFSSISERSGFSNMHANINSPRPSSLRIDLNALPRDFPSEDPFVSTPTSGYGASTVSGRRHIRQRIHVILSNNRQRQTGAEATVLASMNLNPLPSVSSFEQRQQNLRPFFSSHNNLAPCMFNEGSSFRHVDHAKEEVQHLVKYHLKNLSQNRMLDRSTFKEIAQISTHTILAACGIEHRRNMVSTAIEPPENCAHDSNDGPSYLLKGCCSSCFESFVKDVVQQKIIDTTS